VVADCADPSAVAITGADEHQFAERAGLEDFYGGISDYTMALEIDSMFAEALNHRGAAKIELGDDESAFDDLDKAIRFNPKYAEAYTNRGFANFNLEDLQAAYFDFSKALELGPANSDAYLNRGFVKAELGEFGTPVIHGGHIHGPEHPVGYVGRSWNLEKMPSSMHGHLASFPRGILVSQRSNITIWRACPRPRRYRQWIGTPALFCKRKTRM